MTKWVANVLVYLKARSNAGDVAARLLLSRNDAPRRLSRKLSKPSWRQAKAEAKVEARKRMRAEVWTWNINATCGMGAWAGTCDCGCGQAFKTVDSGELDHWVPLSQGGKDERENGWRLSASCHAHKTANEAVLEDGQTGPAVGWNERRRAYCERAGIPFVERRKAG